MSANGAASLTQGPEGSPRLHEPHERSPLLQQSEEDSPGWRDLEPESEPGSPTSTAFPRRNLAIIILLFFILVCLEAGDVLQLAPLNQITEDIICRRIHPDFHAGLNDPRCGESKPVQAELALLRGWLAPLALIPGILTTIPYGFMADKYGRKVVLVLCLLGLFLTEGFYIIVCWWEDIFPLRLVWLSAIFTFIGGGPATLNGISYSMLADLAPEAHRANVFFVSGVPIYLCAIILSPVVAKLMDKDVWLPVLLGQAAYLISLLVALCIPETLGASAPPGNDVPADLDTSSRSEGKDVWAQMKEGAANLWTAASFFIWGNRYIAVILVTFITSTLGKHAQGITLQYARERFHWKWAETNYIVSLKAFAVLVLLMVLLPGSSYVLVRYAGMASRSKDLLLARISCALMLLGNIAIAFSWSSAIMILGLFLFVFGAGYNLLLRSLLSTVIEPHHRGTLFNTISILETLGAVVSGPLLAETFRIGLDLDGIWVGLPFMAASCLFAWTLVLICIIRLPSAGPEAGPSSG